MVQLVRRYWSCETGSALTEYGLMIAVVALGLVGALAGFRNAVGDLTNRTAVTISDQSSRGYGAGGGAGVAPLNWTAAPEPAPKPDSTATDSAPRGSGSPVAAAAAD